MPQRRLLCQCGRYPSLVIAGLYLSLVMAGLDPAIHVFTELTNC
jgi:hypothetical protein